MALEIDKNKIKKIAQKYGLEMVLLFGSQTNDKAKPDSDVDIAYSSKELLSLDEKMGLNKDLAGIFRKDNIDQIDLKSANPFLLHEISRNSQMIFGKEIDYIKFKTRAFRIFVDSQSLFRLQESLIKKRQKLLGKMIYAK